MWLNGTMVYLTPPGVISAAAAINDRNDVAVTLYGTGSDYYSVYLPSAAFWSNGTLVVLGALGAYEARAMDINNHGQVVVNRAAPPGEDAVIWTPR
jgi:uncharacterized membrane protein